jgi:hypothetical protein
MIGFPLHKIGVTCTPRDIAIRAVAGQLLQERALLPAAMHLLKRDKWFFADVLHHFCRRALRWLLSGADNSTT